VPAKEAGAEPFNSTGEDTCEQNKTSMDKNSAGWSMDNRFP
jgi:hypothetical protein